MYLEMDENYFEYLKVLMVFILHFLTFAGDLAWSIIKGPLEALVGVAYGVIVGMVIWYIPSRASVSI